MYHELAKRLNSIDNTLSLLINTDGNRFYLGVYSYGLGEIYSYSSMDAEDSYKHVSNFIECMNNPDKFDKLIKEIEEEPLEV
jgi:hypothetical protein